MLDSNEDEWQAVIEGEAATPAVIDIWWRDNSTGRLMLVLAYLLTRNDAWRNATIRLIAAAPPEAAETRREQLATVLRDVRIPGEVHVVSPNDDSVELIAGVSGGSAIVFLTLAFRDQWFSDWLGNDLSVLLPRLPLTVLTIAAEDVDLSADPDEGEEGERAAAKDAYDDAVRKRAQAAKAADEILSKLMAASREALNTPSDMDAIANLVKLKSALAVAHRDLIEDDAVLASARVAAEELGVKVEDEAEGDE